MDGYEFRRELERRFGKDLPVVAVSGLASDADRERTRQAGFEAHVVKPFDWANLVGVVEDVLHRRQMG
jgi:CheY-like chemotaxis protein